MVGVFMDINKIKKDLKINKILWIATWTMLFVYGYLLNRNWFVFDIDTLYNHFFLFRIIVICIFAAWFIDMRRIAYYKDYINRNKK